MEFDEVTVKDNPGLCRCCLSEGCYKDLSTVYRWMNESEIYADMLFESFDISISQHMDGPNGPNRLICEVCITRLRDACNFKKQVLESEKKFIEMLARGDFARKVVVYQDDLKAELQEMVADPGIANAEYQEDDVDYSKDDLLNPDEPTTSVSEGVTAAPLALKAKRGRPRKKPEDKVEKKIKTKTEQKLKKSRAIVKGANTIEDKHKKMEVTRKLLLKRRNVEHVLEYSNVTPFLWHRGKYRCFYCTEPMQDPDTLRDHTAKAHQLDNLELVVFDRTKNNRNKDAAIKIDVKDISCKMCPTTIRNLEELINHLIIAHDAEYDVNIPNCVLPFLLDKENPSCPICGLKFVFFEYLLRHANKYHLSHDYICDVCGTSFQGENHLNMHNRYYHRGYKCDYCGISLATLSKKTVHERNIHLVNLSTCPQCPVTFKSPYLKKLHLANVHGVERLKIKCPYCPKVYPQESIMSRHMRRVHLRERNVECEVCGDKFFGPYDVKLHMMKHSGDKKFVCTVCGKRFSKKSNLTTHTVVHTGKKSFVCQICNEIFGHHTDLKVHLQSQHPDYEIVEEGAENEFVEQIETSEDQFAEQNAENVHVKPNVEYYVEQNSEFIEHNAKNVYVEQRAENEFVDHNDENEFLEHNVNVYEDEVVNEICDADVAAIEEFQGSVEIEQYVQSSIN